MRNLYSAIILFFSVLCSALHVAEHLLISYVHIILYTDRTHTAFNCILAFDIVKSLTTKQNGLL